MGKVLKLFTLQFVTRYSGLFIAAFWVRDMSFLRNILMSLLVIQAVSHILLPLSFHWQADSRKSLIVYFIAGT